MATVWTLSFRAPRRHKKAARKHLHGQPMTAQERRRAMRLFAWLSRIVKAREARVEAVVTVGD